MPNITLRNLGRDTLLTSKFLSALKLDNELGMLLTRIKADIITCLINQTLAAKIPQDDLFVQDVSHLFNQYAADLGLPEMQVISSNYVPRYDADTENQFKQNFAIHFTCNHVLQKIYDEIQVTIETILNDQNSNVPTKKQMIHDCLKHLGINMEVDLPTHLWHCMKYEIQIFIMHHLAKTENGYFNLHSLTTNRTACYGHLNSEYFLDYTRFRENILLSYVVRSDNKRYPLIAFMQAPLISIITENYFNSFEEYLTLLQEVPEEKRINILKKTRSIDTCPLIQTVVNKKAILNIIPHTQRSLLPGTFKILFTNTFSLDKLLSNKFFQSAEVGKVDVDFTLPDKPENLRTFLGSEAGTLYINGVSEIITKIISWAQANHPAVSISNLHHLIDMIKNYSGDNQKTNLKKFQLYYEGPNLLLGILNKLQDPPATKTEMEKRKEILKNVVDTFVVCEPGIHTNLVVAYVQMSGSINVMVMEVRRQIVEQITLEILCEHDYIDENNRGNEIHYVNSVINHYALDLGLNVIDDYFAIIFTERTRSELYHIVCTAIVPRIQESMTLAKVIEFICMQNLGSVLDKIANISMDNYVKVMESVRESLSIYGKDENFSDNHLVRTNWLTNGIIAESKDMIQTQLLTTILIRLINSGFVNEKHFTRKMVGDICLIIPNDNYHLALVLSADGKYQGLHSYLLKKLFQTPLAEIESAKLEVLEDLNKANEEYFSISQETPVDKKALQKAKEVVSLAMNNVNVIEVEAATEIETFDQTKVNQEQEVSALFANLFHEFMGLFPTPDDIKKLRIIYKCMPLPLRTIFIDKTFSSTFNTVRRNEPVEIDFTTLDDRLRELPESQHAMLLTEQAQTLLIAKLVLQPMSFHALTMRSLGITSPLFHTFIINYINSDFQNLLNYLRTFKINQTPMLNYLDKVDFHGPDMKERLRSLALEYVLLLLCHAPKSQLIHIITLIYNPSEMLSDYDVLKSVAFIKFLQKHLIVKVTNDDELLQILSAISAYTVQTAFQRTRILGYGLIAMLNLMTNKPKSLNRMLDLIGNKLLIDILEFDTQGLNHFNSLHVGPKITSHILGKLTIYKLCELCWMRFDYSFNLANNKRPAIKVVINNIKTIMMSISEKSQSEFIDKMFTYSSIHSFLKKEYLPEMDQLPALFKLALIEELILLEDEGAVEPGTLGAFIARFPEVFQAHKLKSYHKLAKKFDEKIDEQMLILQNRATPDTAISENKGSKIAVLMEVKNATKEFFLNSAQEGSFQKFVDTINGLKDKSEKITHVGYFNSLFKTYSFTTRILNDFIQAAYHILPPVIIVEEVHPPRQLMA
jgi:hypothetical protein